MIGTSQQVAQPNQQKISHQEGVTEKVRFNFWITLENDKYLKRRARQEDRTVASLLNSIITRMRNSG